MLDTYWGAKRHELLERASEADTNVDPEQDSGNAYPAWQFLPNVATIPALAATS
ncbi:hypothetical protein [Mycobacterium intracellulare]|uniref:hypothetical protein n=1 Tax=Mycobacterium intracellulare TaxID=1767 RepID=UPI001EEEB006|nr:hypothetical protein [Mycobacterium intracellulare]MEE3755263.1 hypothetical protein [Mycobacterium intracellulare]